MGGARALTTFEVGCYAATYGDWSPEYADYSDYSDYSEYAEAKGSKYKSAKQPQPGGNYAKAPSAPGYVTPDQLRQALARVKQDIDKVANGVKANTANLND